MSSQFGSLTRVTGEFHDPRTEETFLISRWPQVSRQLRVVSVICMAAVAIAFYENYLLIGLHPDLFWFIAARSFTILSISWILWCALQDRRSKWLNTSIFLSQLAIGGLLSFQTLANLTLANYYQDAGTPYIIFLILAFYVFYPLPVWLTTLSAGFCAAMTLSAMSMAGSGLLVLLDVSVYFIVVVALGFAVTRHLNLTTRQSWLQDRELEREITERRAAESEAHKANKAKDRFLASMSHEFRTPLYGLLGMTNLLKHDLRDENLERVKAIESSGSVLLRLVENVLDVVRMQSDGENIKPSVFDLHTLLNETIDFMDVNAETNASQINLTIESRVPVWVTGDPHPLRRILFNLISNAVKYGRDSTVHVTVRCMAAQKADGKNILEFFVADEGPGISREDRHQVFEEFVRLDEIPNDAAGLGLGLAIVKRLVTLMEGDISIEDNADSNRKTPGCLVRVTLDLPAASSPTKAAPQRTPLAERSLTVLLVEDTDISRKVTSGFLEHAGHTVTVTTTGEEAVEIATSNDFDLILMDISLPGISGIEATRLIHANENPNLTALPIIALTANAFPEDHIRYQMAGMVDVLTKPLDPIELHRTLSKISGNRGFETTKTNPKASAGHILDIAFLKNEFEVLGAALMDELLSDFRGECEKLLSEIGQAVDDDDVEATGLLAHRLASMSGNFGLIELTQSSLAIEATARTGDSKRLAQQIGTLHEITTKSIGELSNAMATLKRVPAIPAK